MSNRLIKSTGISSIFILMLVTETYPIQALTSPLAVECSSEIGGEDSVFSGFTEFNSFFDDLIDTLTGGFNLAGVVDLWRVFVSIMQSETPEEAALSSSAENNLEESYANREDYARQMERMGVLVTVEENTLGTDAQQKTVDSCNFTNEATQVIYDLGEESQELDTSQQILQNISAQLAQEATISNLLKEEITLIRQENALQTVLASQAAQQLHEWNLSQRRENISSRNLTVVNGALIVMPGSTVWQE